MTLNAEMTIEGLLDRTAYRASMYELLASVFLVEPDAALLEALIAQGSARRGAVSAKGAGDRACDEVTALEDGVFVAMAAYEGRDLPQLVTDVRSEYAELFIGPRPPLAPPYESIYVGYPRRLFSDVTRSVRSAYEENGFTVTARNRVPDDHVGYEAEYLGRLCRLEEAALVEGDRDEADRLAALQLRFVRGHLGVWVPLFADRVCGAERADYYAVWARFLRDFVAGDLAYLTELAAAC